MTDELQRRLREELDRRARELPPEVRHGLRQARRRALRAARPTRPPWLLPAGAAAVLLLALALVLPRGDEPTPPLDVATVTVEDWPLLAQGEDLQFYEDLDFILWLDAQGGPPPAPPGQPAGAGPDSAPSPGQERRG